jgi:hypothetical protein
VINNRRKENDRRIRVAVLDSGVDFRHPCFTMAKEEGRLEAKSFLPGLPGDQDDCGHGTHAADLVLRTAPDCILFAARVITDGNGEEFDENVPAIERVRHTPIQYESPCIEMTL